MKKITFILGLFIISLLIGQVNFVKAEEGIKARGSIPILRMLEVK